MIKFRTVLRLFPHAALGICLALSGCQQEETVKKDMEKGNVTFNPTLDGQSLDMALLQSRAADVDFKTSGFTVCGYESIDGIFENKKAETKPDVFKDKAGGSFQTVVYDADTKKYLTKARPWVVAKDNYLSFFAWSDNAADHNSNGITGHSAESMAGYPTIDVAVSNDISKQPDVIAARTIDLRNNALISAIDLQFSHILSKISFKGYSSSGTAVKIVSFNIKYAGTTYSKATYTLNPSSNDPVTSSTAFTYASSKHSGTYPLSGASYPEVSYENTDPAKAQLLGSMMQIPQDAPDGFITAQVTYNVKEKNGMTGPNVSRDIPIKAMKLEEGHHYILAFNFVADNIQVSVNSVADWNEMSSSGLPLVAGPKGDVLLWLDAGDPPYKHTDGAEYWLDRSGYNRHCKIVRRYTEGTGSSDGTKIEYNKAEKVYHFTNPRTGAGIVTNYVELPNLGDLKEMTVQFMMKANDRNLSKGYNCPLIYSNTVLNTSIPSGVSRQLLLNLYEKTGESAYFDTTNDGGSSPSDQSFGERMTLTPITNAQKLAYSFYTCRRISGSYKAMSRNMSHNTELVGLAQVPNRILKFYYGYLGGDFDGDIKLLKIYKKSISMDQIESDYENLKKLHKLPDEPVVPLGKLPTNKNKLIAYFDALDAPKMYSSYGTLYTWQDRTGNGNHLQIYGYNSGITYDATNKCYVFDGSNKQAYMKLVKSLGALKSYSIEFFLSNDGSGATYPAAATKRVLMHFTSQDNTISSDNGVIWYFPNENNNLWGYANGVCADFNDAPSSKDWKNTWGIGRVDAETDNFYTARGSNNQSVVTTNSYAPKFIHCYIGIDAAKTMPFKGKIKRIRIYERNITPQERFEMVTEMKNGMN